MDGGNRALIDRIEELERERDGLKKDLEQFCLHQAGPSLLGIATRLHLQRIAGLEQEIDTLKKKLAALTRENHNLHEELSEAYKIKGQFADLYTAESTKNREIEKQVKFFQGCIGAAFAERDYALMESEKAKEQGEAISQELSTSRDRIQKIESAYEDLWRDNASIQTELLNIKEKISPFEKVVSRFYGIRQAVTGHACDSWDEKCTLLLNDPEEMWSFEESRNSSTSQYIASLEEKLSAMKLSMENLQSKIRVGLEIEHHLNRKARSLEKKIIGSYDIARDGILKLQKFHNQIKSEIITMLQEGNDDIRTMLTKLQVQIPCSGEESNYDQKSDDRISDIEKETSQKEEAEHKDPSNSQKEESTVDATTSRRDDNSNKNSETSNALALALQEKVAALLLLSQQEERHFLEKDLNAALQLKIGELQNSLSQVTHEKVEALLELADLKQKLLQQQRNCKCEMKHGFGSVYSISKDASSLVRDGRLKDLFKKTYLGRWMGKGVSGNEVPAPPRAKENISDKEKCFFDATRSSVETAAFVECINNIERLTSSIRLLHLPLSKERHDVTPPMESNLLDLLDGVILEADQVKVALGTSLPVSSSTDQGESYIIPEGKSSQSTGIHTDRPDISAAVFEMAELLILLASLLKENVRPGTSGIEEEHE